MSKKIDLLIVDYRAEGFKRYAINLSTEIHKIQPEIKLGACYMEKKTDVKIQGFEVVLCAQEYNYDASKILDEYSPKAILTFAHRFFDYMFTVEAHRRRLLVFNFQHGLYMSNTVISELSVKTVKQVIEKKREKLNIYLWCSYHINKNNLGNIIRFFLIFLKKRSLYKVMNFVFGTECNADVSYIYGEYWKKFYREQYLEIYTRFCVVGYPELEGENIQVNRQLFENPSLPIVCYLAQTSVEDGLLKESDLLMFLAELERCLAHINLVIKFHPRSNRDLYKSLLTERNNGKVYIWDEDGFPCADMYIGHESTVIARAMYITSKIMIVRLSVDRISPFEKYSHYVSYSCENLLESINRMYSENTYDVDTSFQKYVYHNDNGAIVQTAKDIFDNMLSEEIV